LLLQVSNANLSVHATLPSVLVVASALTMLLKLTAAHVMLDTLALVVSWWTGALTNHA